MSARTASRRGDFKNWQTHTTRWADNDAYGHVNNTVYYQWFDSAVNAWLVGHGLLDIADGNPICLVVETRCSYFVPLEFPQPVDVGLTIVHLGKSSIRYRVGIFAEGAETAAADGEFVHVVVDRATRRPIDIPAAWRAKLETLA